PNRSSATRPIDNSLGGFFLHWLSVPFRGTPAIWDKLPSLPMALQIGLFGHGGAPFDTRPIPASHPGGAGARPDPTIPLADVRRSLFHGTGSAGTPHDKKADNS